MRKRHIRLLGAACLFFLAVGAVRAGLIAPQVRAFSFVGHPVRSTVDVLASNRNDAPLRATLKLQVVRPNGVTTVWSVPFFRLPVGTSFTKVFVPNEIVGVRQVWLSNVVEESPAPSRANDGTVRLGLAFEEERAPRDGRRALDRSLLRERAPGGDPGA